MRQHNRVCAVLYTTILLSIALVGAAHAVPTADSCTVVEVALGNQYTGMATDTSTGYEDIALVFAAEAGMVWLVDLVAPGITETSAASNWFRLAFASGTDNFIQINPDVNTTSDGGFYDIGGRIFAAPDSSLTITSWLVVGQVANATLGYSVRKVPSSYAAAAILGGQ